MQRPKAWLPFGGQPLLVRVVEALRRAFEHVVVVGAEGQDLPFTGATVLRDGLAARGPLAGIQAALIGAGTPAVFAVSCDAPFLQPALARHMAHLAEGHDAAVPRWQDRLHPLLAVYSTRLLPAVSRLLKEDRLRPVFLLDEGDVRIVEEDEILAADPHGLSFCNMNSPDEYAAAVEAIPVRVTFELFGPPRLLAGGSEVAVDVPRPALLGSALAALAREAPALVGSVLDVHGIPSPAYLVSVNGREFTVDRGRTLADGDRLLLLSASAGG
ncbi:MAG: NTP transferase domain-containing protein [Gemmatimonadetes bacterium]|nr:NTP transferase domain-containing protein [Gemmatimonadota bacterium]